MKNNMIQTVTAIAFTSLLVGVISSQLTSDYLTSIAVTVGYLAVGALVALISADYRRNQRGYSA
jgi:hypothetical protein